jgi:hypothetical protein
MDSCEVYRIDLESCLDTWVIVLKEASKIKGSERPGSRAGCGICHMDIWIQILLNALQQFKLAISPLERKAGSKGGVDSKGV